MNCLLPYSQFGVSTIVGIQFFLLPLEQTKQHLLHNYILLSKWFILTCAISKDWKLTWCLFKWAIVFLAQGRKDVFAVLKTNKLFRIELMCQWHSTTFVSRQTIANLLNALLYFTNHDSHEVFNKLLPYYIMRIVSTNTLRSLKLLPLLETTSVQLH